MANMPNANKRHVTMRVNVETCRAVEKKFGRKGDASASIPFIRALEDATRDVILDAADYQRIANEVSANARKVKGGCHE